MLQRQKKMLENYIHLEIYIIFYSYGSSSFKSNFINNLDVKCIGIADPYIKLIL